MKIDEKKAHPDNWPIYFKMVVVGDMNVGKTNLCMEKYTEKYVHTLGAGFHVKRGKIGEHEIKLQI